MGQGPDISRSKQNLLYPHSRTQQPLFLVLQSKYTEMFFCAVQKSAPTSSVSEGDLGCKQLVIRPEVLLVSGWYSNCCVRILFHQIGATCVPNWEIKEKGVRKGAPLRFLILRRLRTSSAQELFPHMWKTCN